MLNNNETESGIKKFNHELTRDATFDLYNNFKPSELEDGIKNLGNKFSNIYLIECSPFKIEERKAFKDIYEILKRYQHTAEGRALELLIGEYNQETIDDMNKQTENLRKEYEGMGIDIQDPKRFIHIIGYYGGTSGRTIQVVINFFKENFPEKIKTISPDDMK